jgi:uncharacterized protein (TIGR03435 family)
MRFGATLALLGCGMLWGQAKPIEFEVASVKAVPAGARRPLYLRALPGGHLEISSLTPEAIIREAFGVKPYQLSGGPAWLQTERFDISARAEGNSSQDQVMAMLQTLLAERFKLKIRRESKEGNIYALVVAKSGPKLMPPTGDFPAIRIYRNTQPTEPGVSYTLKGEGASMALLAERLGEALMRPVLDKTGVARAFDFKLDYATDDNPDTGPSIISAIQEQLGLKLEAAKGPVETLIIEHIERPIEN